MWLLILLCTHTACDADLVAVHYEYTQERCIELGKTVYGDMGYTWMCAIDRTSLSAWEDFE